MRAEPENIEQVIRQGILTTQSRRFQRTPGRGSEKWRRRSGALDAKQKLVTMPSVVDSWSLGFWTTGFCGRISMGLWPRFGAISAHCWRMFLQLVPGNRPFSLFSWLFFADHRASEWTENLSRSSSR